MFGLSDEVRKEIVDNMMKVLNESKIVAQDQISKSEEVVQSMFQAAEVIVKRTFGF